jgi:hypothetical protein
VVAREILMSVDVTVPLTAIGSVLVTLVLDNDLEGKIDKIDSTDRAIVVADDDVAFRDRQTHQD